MVEPSVDSEALAVECDAGSRLLVVRSSTPTPAGSAGLEVGDGIEVDVDVARPVALSAVTVELPATGDPGVLPAGVRRRLGALLGAERAGQLDDVVRESAARRSIVRRTWAGADWAGGPSGSAGPTGVTGADWGGGSSGSAGPTGAGRAGGSSGSAGPTGVTGAGRAPVPGALATAALAHAAAWRPGAPRLARLAGLVEAAIALDSLGPPFDLQGAARRDLRFAADLVDDLLTHGGPVLDPRASRVLAPAMQRAVAIVGERTAAAAAFAALVPELGRPRVGPSDRGAPGGGHHRGRPVGGRPPVRAGQPGVGLAWRVSIDVRALPGDLAEAAAVGRRSGPCEVEVLIPGWAERGGGLWARAFDAADDTVVGMGPLRRSGPDAVAHIIVPPVSTGRIEVDITDRPELPRPSPALAVVERAISLGVTAAQADRLGEAERAARRWQQCARAWDSVGDPVRGDQARAYARQAVSSAARSSGRPSRVVGPLVCDVAAGGGPPARHEPPR